MTSFRVAAVQATYILMDRDATIERVAELTAEAAQQGAQLVVLPEQRIQASACGLVAPAGPVEIGGAFGRGGLLQGVGIDLALVGNGVGLLVVVVGENLFAGGALPVHRLVVGRPTETIGATGHWSFVRILIY